MTINDTTPIRAYCFGGPDSAATLLLARRFHQAVVAARAGFLQGHEVYPSYDGNSAVWLVYRVYDTAAIDTIYDTATGA